MSTIIKHVHDMLKGYNRRKHDPKASHVFLMKEDAGGCVAVLTE